MIKYEADIIVNYPMWPYHSMIRYCEPSKYKKTQKYSFCVRALIMEESRNEEYVSLMLVEKLMLGYTSFKC